MNNTEKTISNALLKGIEGVIQEPGGAPKGALGELIESYHTFLKCVQLRQEIERFPQESSLTATGVVDAPPIFDRYWSENTHAFYFGGGEVLVEVRPEDHDAAREWLMLSAPTMKALVPFQQARSFADKWSIEKRRDYTVSPLLGGSVK